jgi:hypothetical protein
VVRLLLGSLCDIFPRAHRLKESRKFWARWRVRIGYPVALIYWLLAAPTRQSIVIGGVMAAFGLLIRGLSSGYLRKDEELTTSGPYACTRNPLYLGSAFLAGGFVVAGFSWIAGALVAVYFTAFYYAVMRSEAKDLRERFGAEFDEYAARVPLFFPGFGRKGTETISVPPPEKAFSWARYRRNREYQALIGTIAGLGSLWLRMWIRKRFGY